MRVIRQFSHQPSLFFPQRPLPLAKTVLGREREGRERTEERQFVFRRARALLAVPLPTLPA